MNWKEKGKRKKEPLVPVGNTKVMCHVDAWQHL
jgi:hypothetical protein